MNQIFETDVDIKNKVNLTKIGRATMGIFPQTHPPKFELFTLLSEMHKIFKVNKYKGKIKFDKIWGYQNGGSPSNGAEKM